MSALMMARIAPAFRPAQLGRVAVLGVQASRGAATVTLTNEENLKLLNQQRKLRPSSPHFTIYQPQLTWLSSIANRVTGSGLSVGLYAFATAYLVAPTLGLGFDGASVINLVASFPEWLKYTAKAIFAAPFWFHTFNGFRHLSWDSGFFLDLKKSYIAGYTVIGLTGLATIATVFFV